MTDKTNLLTLLSVAAMVAGCQRDQASSVQTGTVAAQTTVTAPFPNDNLKATNVEFAKSTNWGANDQLPSQKIEFADVATQGTNDAAIKQTTEFSEKLPQTDLENGLSAIGR